MKKFHLPVTEEELEVIQRALHSYWFESSENSEYNDAIVAAIVEDRIKKGDYILQDSEFFKKGTK